MVEQLSVAHTKKGLYNGDHMLHQQNFDPNLSDYKDEICPSLETPKMPQLGPVFYFIYDFHAQHYRYVSEEVRQVLGYSPEMLYERGEAFIRERMPNQDREAFMRMVLRALRHLRYGIPDKERAKYSVSFDYRLRNAESKTLHVLQQSLNLVYDRTGSLVFSVEKLTDISHRPPETTPMLSIYGPDPKYSVVYYANREYGNTHRVFTRSEMRVLQLLDRAHSTQEIAQLLSLSCNTIATHRKNMLKKAGVNDTPKLLRFARRSGILS